MTAGVSGGSVADVLRRSARAVQVLLAAGVVVAGISAYAILGVLHPRVDALNSAVAGLNLGRSGMQQERFALASYLATGDHAALAEFDASKRVVAAGDAQVLRSGLGGHDILTKLISVRSAEQAWEISWVGAVLGGGQTAAATPSLQAQGNQLFAAYVTASSQAISDLSHKARNALDQEWQAAIAGLAADTLLIVVAAVLAADHRRLASRASRRGAESLAEIARRIEAGDASDLRTIRVPAEFEELGAVFVGWAREMERLRGAINVSAVEADARNQKLMQLLELMREIGGNLSIRPVMDSVVAAAVKLSGATRGVLWTAADGELRQSADTDGSAGSQGTEPHESVVQAATYGRSSRSGTVRAIGAGAQQVVDVRESSEGTPSESSIAPRIAVPMTFTGRVVGVVELRGGAVGELTADDIELLETLASNAASAIEAARAHGVTESLSLTDPLTRLPNRRQLEHDLATETERARRYQRSSALIMLDVDGFKAFNDKYGHQAGDQVLAQFGDLLAASIRASDSAYRYGGEEFAVLVREASVEAAIDLAERLREAIVERFSDLPADAPVTASFGVVGAEQVEPEPAVLIKAADEALYAAKERGRNRVIAFK